MGLIAPFFPIGTRPHTDVVGGLMHQTQNDKTTFFTRYQNVNILMKFQCSCFNAVGHLYKRATGEIFFNFPPVFSLPQFFAFLDRCAHVDSISPCLHFLSVFGLECRHCFSCTFFNFFVSQNELFSRNFELFSPTKCYSRLNLGNLFALNLSFRFVFGCPDNVTRVVRVHQESTRKLN